ncbi:MAG: hypothetical protein CMG25_04975 [Candidatus Marinimicrobia bacterium]|nr:hypothetical protein [Candidatus Neomarinimicrobiota bacterium]
MYIKKSIMKYKIKLSKRFACHTNSSSSFYFRGHFFINDDLYEGSKAISYLQNNLNSIPENGSFLAIVIIDDNLKIISDKSGSMIAYYYLDDDYFIVSDKVKNILKIYHNYKFIDNNLDEFKVAGFVTENDTLIDRIRSVGTGQILTYNKKNNLLELKNYFEYIPNQFDESNINKLISSHNSIVDRVFYRLKKYCSNKQIIVPLSGGLDSRLIVHELKRNGFSNVICFSYGKNNNKESLISKKIADKLGFKWFFVEYSNKIWNEVFKTSDFKNYFFSADNFQALPHIQDFPAVNYLIKNNIIDNNAIFIPGHTGDFIAGGHILPIFENKHINEDQLVDLIIQKHFRVNQFKSIPIKSQEHIKSKIYSSIKKMYDRKINPAFIYDWYDWKERQQKHVLHSLRVYDYFNYDWYLPLWDSELIHFWREIPLDKKINKKLYKEYLESIDNYDIFSNTKQFYKKNKFRLYLEKFHIIRIIITMRRKLISIKNKIKKYLLDYYLHPLQWYGMFSYHKVLSIYMFQNIYSILAEYYISTIKENCD